ncbi:hypothetical protein A0H76_2644 [Hepatospora eriocheir]|uniref:Uncharacterized protein n=1 Tax=Hepatospora eriocheir TaxID=1081669 RepID=A0A1X0QFD3_9MICR|nr:hypothetical protein A0H76_2644 [Hepatospora eriocheir]
MTGSLIAVLRLSYDTFALRQLFNFPISISSNLVKFSSTLVFLFLDAILFILCSLIVSKSVSSTYALPVFINFLAYSSIFLK